LYNTNASVNWCHEGVREGWSEASPGVLGDNPPPGKERSNTPNFLRFGRSFLRCSERWYQLLSNGTMQSYSKLGEHASLPLPSSPGNARARVS
jgi:hypothetical protein